jgi:ADP-heptose:LPS heptosyltransferase
MVCTGLIGDTVMSLPAVFAARELFPSAELAALVSPTTRSLLNMAGGLDRLIESGVSPLTLRPSGRKALARVWTLVRAGHFDLVIIFLGDDFAPMLTRAGIPHRVFVAGAPYDVLATAAYDIGDPRTWGPAERLGAWRALGLEPPRTAVALRPPPDATAAMASILQTSLDRPWLVVHPFGRTTDQHWPLAMVRDFMRLADQRLGLQSLVVGESPVAAALASSDTRFRLVGRLTIEELTALLSLCSCVVSTDSGPLHIAGSLGRRGVGLFRASRPEHARRYPSISSVIAPALGCCRGLCSWDECRWSPCRQMSSILPDTVLEALEANLRGASDQ